VTPCGKKNFINYLLDAMHIFCYYHYYHSHSSSVAVAVVLFSGHLLIPSALPRAILNLNLSLKFVCLVMQQWVTEVDSWLQHSSVNTLHESLHDCASMSNQNCCKRFHFREKVKKHCSTIRTTWQLKAFFTVKNKDITHRFSICGRTMWVICYNNNVNIGNFWILIFYKVVQWST